MRGAINQAWDALGGSAGVLGVPSEDETTNGDTVTQKFTGGEISWDRKTKAFTTVPPELAGQLAGIEVPSDATSAIAAARRAAGGALGPLGAEEGAQYAIGADGVGQNYAGGKIFYSPDTGANVVTGQVLAKYESVGGPTGDLGLPTSSEADGGLRPAEPSGRFRRRGQAGDLLDARLRRGDRARRDERRPGRSSVARRVSSVRRRAIRPRAAPSSASSSTADRSRGTRRPASSVPSRPACESQLAGLEVPGADAPRGTGGRAGRRPAAPNSGDKWYSSPWWWLLGLIPLVGVIALVAIAVLRNRRPRQDDEFNDDPYERGYDGGYEDRYESGYPGRPEPAVYPPQSPWASAPPAESDTDDDEAGDDDYEYDEETGDYNSDEYGSRRVRPR